MTEIFNKNCYKRLRQKLRKEIPRAEIILWNRLRRKQIANLKFHRQYSIGNFIVDFYCPEIKLVVELDGDTHFSDNHQEKDRLRDDKLKRLGLNILRFNNNDVYHNLAGVIDKIYEMIQTPPNLPFRKGEEKNKETLF